MMPNWCLNSLRVSGSKRIIKLFVRTNTVVIPHNNNNNNNTDHDYHLELTFEGIAAIPKSQELNWYAWCYSNWGCKWDANDAYVEYEEDDDNMYVNFDTAWGPPDIWFEKLAKRYPSLELEMRYEESGCGFCGIMTSKAGESTVNDNSAKSPSTKYIDMMVIEFGYQRSEFNESAFEYEVRRVKENKDEK